MPGVGVAGSDGGAAEWASGWAHVGLDLCEEVIRIQDVERWWEEEEGECEYTTVLGEEDWAGRAEEVVVVQLGFERG